MKTIDICIVTWPRSEERLDYLRQTLESIATHVKASRHWIRVYLSSETLDVAMERFVAVNRLCGQMRELFPCETHWRAKRPSLGGNQNDALLLGHGEYKLLSQDDWVWTEHVDLSWDCEFLQEGTGYSFVRYATFYTEFKPRDFSIPLAVGCPRYLHRVNTSGPWPYGDQPHLRRSDFAKRLSETGGKPIGFYTPGLQPDGSDNFGTAEIEMAVHLVENGWKIAAYNPNVVSHCGSLSCQPERWPAGVTI